MHHAIARVVLGALAVVALALVPFVVGGGCSSDPITQKAKIGAPCMSDPDCGSQPWFTCYTDRPGGYCSKGCLSDADCPTAESICAFDNGTGSCKAKCNLTSDCRGSTYICHGASNDKTSFASHAYCDSSGMGGGGDAGATPSDAMMGGGDAGGGAGG